MPRFILSLHHIKRRVGVREINVSHRDKKKGCVVNDPLTLILGHTLRLYIASWEFSYCL